MTKFRKLGRPAAHRMSMLRTMVSQLVKHERIETTVAKVIYYHFCFKSNILGIESFISYTYTSLTSILLNARQRKFDVLLTEWYNSGKSPMKDFKKKERDNKEAGERFILECLEGDPRFGAIEKFVLCEGTLAAARRATAFVRGDDVMHKLFTELAYRYKDREGGYTRLLRTRIRIGDAAPLAYIEFVDRENELREAKPPTPQPPEKPPMDPWKRSRVSKQWPSASISPTQAATASEN